MIEITMSQYTREYFLSLWNTNYDPFIAKFLHLNIEEYYRLLESYNARPSYLGYTFTTIEDAIGARDYCNSLLIMKILGE